MLRRAAPSAVLPALASSSVVAQARAYRIIPHTHRDIEELAETQNQGRWYCAKRPNYSEPMKNAERMCEKLNLRENRRKGVMPEKSIARRMSNFWGKDGQLQEPAPNRKTKWLTITVIGFDGHPYVFRLNSMPDMTLNQLIDGSGMNHGWGQLWSKCSNPDCIDMTHGDGCLVNVDIDTLASMPVPGRHEYYALTHFRTMNRPDVKFNSRFSCQLKITEEMDGGVFAMKGFNSRALREDAQNWGDTDNDATIAWHKCRKIEPYAPMLEEPTVRDFPWTPELFFAQGYEDVMKHKYPDYKRKDGLHTRPEYWAAYV